MHQSISEDCCELEIHVATLLPPRVHCRNSAAIAFDNEMSHHVTCGTNLAKFAVLHNSSLTLHYYAGNLIKRKEEKKKKN